MIMRGTLYIISAPSGAGKTSLVHALCEHMPNLQISVSSTTRARRANEVDGQDYHFVSKDLFLERVKAGDFLEYAEVFGHFYGTSQSWVESILDQGQDVVLEIDWQGAAQVRKKWPGSVSVFILPPSKAALLARLNARGQDDETIIQARMASALDQMSHYAEFNYLVVNDDFSVALADLEAIVRAERMTLARQQWRFQPLLQVLLN